MKIYLGLTLAAALHASTAQAAEPVSLATFLALARPAPTVQLTYGPAPAQGVDVFMPARPGPHPVAIFIHGGCWNGRHPGSGREQLRHLGAELARDGIAVWSIGYRRANEAGGGFPGTYTDVNAALALLRSEAPRLGLDLQRTILVGHSAGGHLALWAAVSHALPSDHPARAAAPLFVQRIISLAGIGDLQAFTPQIDQICGAGIAQSLVGSADAKRANVYADTSPAAMAASSTPVLAISAIRDRLVPPYVAHDYMRAQRDKQGAAVELLEIPEAGHFDLVTTGTPAWSNIRQRIADALGMAPPKDVPAKP